MVNEKEASVLSSLILHNFLLVYSGFHRGPG